MVIPTTDPYGYHSNNASNIPLERDATMNNVIYFEVNPTICRCDWVNLGFAFNFTSKESIVCFAAASSIEGE